MWNSNIWTLHLGSCIIDNDGDLNVRSSCYNFEKRKKRDHTWTSTLICNLVLPTWNVHSLFIINNFRIHIVIWITVTWIISKRCVCNNVSEKYTASIVTVCFNSEGVDVPQKRSDTNMHCRKCHSCCIFAIDIVLDTQVEIEIIILPIMLPKPTWRVSIDTLSQEQPCPDPMLSSVTPQSKPWCL